MGEIEWITAAEIVERKQRPTPTQFGPWHYREDNLTVELQHDDPRIQYYIDLERSRNSRATLDWIAQVSRKTWATPEIVGHLVKALDAHIRLQATQCGCGLARGHMTEDELRAAYAERPR